MVSKKSVSIPLVSVNLRTYNSGKTIEETLRSVRKQTYPRIETVVSDGFSKDNTIEILKNFKVRIYFADKLGDARYQNVKSSKGEYVLSLDSDQVMDEGLIEKCVEVCERKGYDAIIISEKSFITHNTFLEKLITYDKYLIDKDRKGREIFDTACPRFFRRKILLSIDWPKHLSIFDDTILYAVLLKKGAKVGFLKSHSIWHHEVGSWVVLIKKFYRYGKGYFKALGVSPGVITAHSLPRRSYFSKNILKRPGYILPILFLYLVKVVAASAGAFASVLEGKKG